MAASAEFDNQSMVVLFKRQSIKRFNFIAAIAGENFSTCFTFPTQLSESIEQILNRFSLVGVNFHPVTQTTKQKRHQHSPLGTFSAHFSWQSSRSSDSESDTTVHDHRDSPLNSVPCRGFCCGLIVLSDWMSRLHLIWWVCGRWSDRSRLMKSGLSSVQSSIKCRKLWLLLSSHWMSCGTESPALKVEISTISHVCEFSHGDSRWELLSW